MPTWLVVTLCVLAVPVVAIIGAFVWLGFILKRAALALHMLVYE